MYTCGGCGRTVEFDTNSLGVRCTYCNKKVFYKERPTIAKKLEAR